MLHIKFNRNLLFILCFLFSGCGADNNNQLFEPESSIGKENEVTTNLSAEERVRREISMTYIVYWKEEHIDNESRVEALIKATELNIKGIRAIKNMDVIMIKNNLSPDDILIKIDNSGMVKQVVQEQLITTH